MCGSRFDTRHRPRELRRRVVLPARLRHGASWSDACILNVSSRGLMIQSVRPSTPGSIVELYRGAYLIQAKVVWREGLRAGLQVDDAIPVDEILILGKAPGLQLTAADSSLVDRRRAVRPRTAESARWQGRAIEFAGTIGIAVALCVGALSMLGQAFSAPMAMVAEALGR